MANINESLGLKLGADVSEWTNAFAKAGVDTDKLAQKVGKLGTGLESAFGKSVTNVGALATQVGKLGLALDSTFGKGTTALSRFSSEAQQAQRHSVGLGTSIVKLADGFNEISQAVRGVFQLGQSAVELAKFSGELRQLEKNVPVETLQMMQRAVGGSVDKLTLMQLAMRNAGSEFRLTEQGMQTVLTAADNLGDKLGKDTVQVFEGLMAAIRTGRTGPLREFGIQLDLTGTKQQQLNQLMVEMARIAATPVDVDPQLEAIERLQTATQNWIIDMRDGLGKMVNWAIEAIDGISNALSATSSVSGRAAIEKSARESADRAYRQLYGIRETGVTTIDAMQGIDRQSLEWRSFYQSFTGRFQGRENQRRAEALPMQLHEIWSRQIAAARGGLTEGEWAGEDRVRRSRERSGGILGDLGRAFSFTPGQRAVSALTDAVPAYANRAWSTLQGWGRAAPSGIGTAFAAGAATGGAEAMIGPEQLQRLAETRAQLQDQTTAIGGSYAALTAGITAAVDAAITGSENIGKAALRASATALKAIAIEATAKAVFAGAEALLGLNPAAAAAAAKYAAAAAIAGAGAVALGAAAGGGGGGSAARPSTPSGGGAIGPGVGSQGPQQMNIVVNVGDGFVGRADELAVEIADKVSHGIQTGRVRNMAQTAPGAVTFR
jgi:hypothetical protein